MYKIIFIYTKYMLKYLSISPFRYGIHSFSDTFIRSVTHLPRLYR